MAFEILHMATRFHNCNNDAVRETEDPPPPPLHLPSARLLFLPVTGSSLPHFNALWASGDKLVHLMKPPPHLPLKGLPRMTPCCCCCPGQPGPVAAALRRGTNSSSCGAKRPFDGPRWRQIKPWLKQTRPCRHNVANGTFTCSC